MHSLEARRKCFAILSSLQELDSESLEFVIIAGPSPLAVDLRLKGQQDRFHLKNGDVDDLSIHS